MTAVPYREPYQFSAGVLALLVHGVFFAVLYFGLSWQTKPPMEAMSVELWDAVPMPAGVPTGDLSPATVAPDVAPVIIEQPPPAPVEVAKPDIVVPEKKPPKPVPVPQNPVTKPAHTAQKPVESNRKSPQSILERYGIEGGNANTTRGGGRVGQQLRLADAVKATEVDRILAEYIGKIKAQIKRYIVMPPDVPENARVEFLVTLLPDGSVMTVRLANSSHAGYANAVERAIFKAQPLPLPPDSELFGQFRELKLVFKPIE
jgi:colicin import membrane protein